MKVPSKRLHPTAIEELKRYSFPGNVRELRNLLERALILGQGVELQPEDFVLQSPGSASSSVSPFSVEALAAQLPKQLDLRETITQLEKALIQRSLDLAKGVQAEAARQLGLSRSDLGYKVGKHGLSIALDDNSRERLP
jgi:transcriptional regulator with GAF, ATPase, and Fis domain